MRRLSVSTDALLPPSVAGWPTVLRRGGRIAVPAEVAEAAAALRRIRAEALFWPVPRAGASTPRALALDRASLGLARAVYPDAEIVLSADPSEVAPDRLEEVFAPSGATAAPWARLGGLRVEKFAPDPAALLAAACGVSPWSGEPLTLAEAVEAQALLHAAARRARGPLRLVGMTPWKRRCLRPFLTGPDGPPHPARRGTAGPSVVWGDARAEEGALRVEDGFLRSVGLGVRHTPPVSLVIDSHRPHFDATRPNGFEAAVAAAGFTPELLDRAARLRTRLVELGLTKYNVGEAAPLPSPGGREAVLVPGQVARDASIRLGATTVRTDVDLLRAARVRFPDAFLLYKPHPDVLTGLREGRAPEAEAARLADATVGRVSAESCLAWADRVATITSLIGFEALLRGRAATVFGRPFYAGWGLTDDVDPPPPERRPRRLTLDELVAAALILFPSYVDPKTGLPCPPEVVLERLAEERERAGLPTAQLRRVWRDGVSWLLNRL